jgi:hypothetical protein
MTTAIVDQPSRTRLWPSPVGQPGRTPIRPSGPPARPDRSRPIPSDLLPDGAVRACRVNPVTGVSASWRLTDRGIAVVLALAAMIILAAVTVIGLTAWRVTGPEYQPTGVSQLSQR